jgi:chaperonin GroEL (HSP60 family)
LLPPETFSIASFSLQAAVEEGIVVGGGCTLLRLAAKVDAIKDTLDNDEQKVKKDEIPEGF